MSVLNANTQYGGLRKAAVTAYNFNNVHIMIFFSYNYNIVLSLLYIVYWCV